MKRVSLKFTWQACWQYVNTKLFERRVEEFVRWVVDNPDGVILVEGVFALNVTHVVWVLAMVRYDPNASVGRMYNIVGHAFRPAR